MNNLKFFRFMSRTRLYSGKQSRYSGVLQQIAKRSTSTTVSPPNIKQKEVFNDALPGIIDTLLSSPKFHQRTEITSWVKKVLEHNLSGGKKTRGIMTVMAYEMLEKPENVTEENVKRAQVLGWCIELLQAYFCMLDDIMDQSTTRRGQPCWFRIPEVGLGAINDSIFISCAINELLEIHLLKTPQFVPVTLLFNESILYTCMGQHMDYTTAHHANKKYSHFTIEQYETLGRYKTSYYSFRLPILLGLSLVKDFDKNLYADIDDISFKLGHLFQMQDDYIDCYGDEAETGKAGTDIQEGKCTWLAATALQHCNETQRDIFTKHYAGKKLDDVAIIKGLYDELQIHTLYKEKEKELYDDIVRRVKQLPFEMAPNFFFSILDKLQNRKR